MKNLEKNKIKILPDDVARRIAAGEVIDRPAAVLRELLDNSLDAGATEIFCYLEEGGKKLIRIIDNGFGMDKEDLELSILPHATSKIEKLEDLDQLESLGFRGEALASLAACSHLKITSQTTDGLPQLLEVNAGKIIYFGASQGKPGTSVEVSELFFNMPARKKFLKSASSESWLCKNIFLEKALAFPQVTFKLFNNNKLDFYLPSSSLLQRVTQAFQNQLKADLLFYAEKTYPDFKFEAVLAYPDLNYTDRRFLQIFVNKRRTNDFNLTQAVEYGYVGFLPGGLRPVAFVFVKIKPELVDFNIHPAKKEVRFRQAAQLHSALLSFIKESLSQNCKKAFVSAEPKLFDQAFVFERKIALNKESATSFSSDSISFIAGKSQNNYQAEAASLRYLGQLYKTYLLALLENELIIVDQHAAHERIIYNSLLSQPFQSVSMAFPLSVELEKDEALNLIDRISNLQKLGFEIEKIDNNSFWLKALPAQLSDLPAQEWQSFFKGLKGSEQDLLREAISLAACRKALKAQEMLDEVSALELIKKALDLSDPHCPHGRPVFIRLDQSLLASLFKRVV